MVYIMCQLVILSHIPSLCLALIAKTVPKIMRGSQGTVLSQDKESGADLGMLQSSRETKLFQTSGDNECEVWYPTKHITS